MEKSKRIIELCPECGSELEETRREFIGISKGKGQYLKEFICTNCDCDYAESDFPEMSILNYIKRMA